MPKLTQSEVERLEGPPASQDTTCIQHFGSDSALAACTRCGASFFRCCITYTMENRPGLCGQCGETDYRNELFNNNEDSIADNTTAPDYEAMDWASREEEDDQ